MPNSKPVLDLEEYEKTQAASQARKKGIAH